MTDLFNFNKEDILSGATADQAVVYTKITDLFNNKDILTVATADQAVICTKGYFGDGLLDLTTKIKQGDVGTLANVNANETYCFKNNNGVRYMFFLPLDKVKNKEPSYRPLKNIDELFDFFIPNFNKDSVYDQTGNKIEVDTNKKAVYLLGKKIILKKKENGQINALFIQHIKFNSDNSNVYLNNVSLDYIFYTYDIEKDDKWVTFGILEE